MVVGPETLKQRVKLLRESLSDSSRRPRYVETVRGRGYRLLPAVTLKDDDPDDWPSRLRSRLRGLLGPSGGGDRGPGSLAIGGLMILMSLPLTGTGVLETADLTPPASVLDPVNAAPAERCTDSSPGDATTGCETHVRRIC